MKKRLFACLIGLCGALTVGAAGLPTTPGSRAGWQKYPGNPILGGELGTCFDVTLLKDGAVYRMWFSWRPKAAIALVESADGIHWSAPQIVLGPNPQTEWEGDINRPSVVKRQDGYHMWYTGQARGRSGIGYATSPDGVRWTRRSAEPVLSSEAPWEDVAVMCPHVLWDDAAQQYRMWYSAGEQYEPNAIGYATSPDGLHWTKHGTNPIFTADPDSTWEQHKVTACQVVPVGDGYVMFYIGFRDEDHAQIGLARSRDGVTNWQRHPANPILWPAGAAWDGDACYKPYALFDATNDRWMLWYNGRKGSVEQIGLALHDGLDLGFPPQAPSPAVLKAKAFEHYVDAFARNDEELYAQAIPNAAAWAFLQDKIPLLDCPDKDLEEIYYFRWWTYRKHIKATPDGYIISEFLPSVGWAGKHNSISCAAGHHFYEGRWLADPKVLDDYAVFWFRKGGEPRRYSFWAADALWARYLVTGDAGLVRELLPDLIGNYEAWETNQRDDNGLFWQVDGRDGMEVSISGALHPQAQGYRATINSYMYGDALAIAQIAELAGRPKIAEEYRTKAAQIKTLVQQTLWDPKAHFFKVLPRGANQTLSDARELHGYTPWYFNLPDPDKAVAWKQVMDSEGFYAPFGPTTAEQRHPQFRIAYEGHECQWNGPSWPYATSVTLVALANLLNGAAQDVIDRSDYLDLLTIYTKSHRLKREDGRIVPWIDENLNPFTGDWIARTRLKSWKDGTWDAGKGGKERGKDYNHSTYCDLIITGLIGLRPRADEAVEINPLVPAGHWDYFCLDQIPYHGRSLTILYDKTGGHYHRGQGLRLLVDGEEIAARDRLGRLVAPLPVR